MVVQQSSTPTELKDVWIMVQIHEERRGAISFRSIARARQDLNDDGETLVQGFRSTDESKSVFVGKDRLWLEAYRRG